MAVFWRGLSDAELSVDDRDHRLRGATGPLRAFEAYGRQALDRGVGDKVSLILAPLVAACGPRSTAFGTGARPHRCTLDKLDAIPGWRSSFSNSESARQLEEIGCVICAAGAGLAPRIASSTRS